MESLSPFGAGRYQLSHVGWSTYFTLRSSLMAVAFALPLVLVMGLKAFADLWIQSSLSAYYHAGDGATRDFFVGGLIAVAMMLVVYKGFSGFENWALNIAAIALAVVALVPDDRSTLLSDRLPWLHGAAAVSFFACLVYVAFFRSGDTLGLLPHPRDQRTLRTFYRWLSYAMAGFVLAAVSVAWVNRSESLIFVLETAGVWAFAAYWYFKTVEMRESGADALAGRQLLRRPGGYTLGDAFRPLPVRLTDVSPERPHRDGGGAS